MLSNLKLYKEKTENPQKIVKKTPNSVLNTAEKRVIIIKKYLNQIYYR